MRAGISKFQLELIRNQEKEVDTLLQGPLANLRIQLRYVFRPVG